MAAIGWVGAWAILALDPNAARLPGFFPDGVYTLPLRGTVIASHRAP